jgi:RIO kinase 1
MNESNSKVLRHVSRKITEYEKESRMLRKDTDELEVVEEVFDRNVLINLHNLFRAGYLKSLNGVISSGKEARVYWGIAKDDRSIAAKIYLTLTVEFKKRLPYITGDPRFKKIKKGTRNLIELWAKKEYKNLWTAYANGVNVPKPITLKGMVLLMEFFGKNGQAAPTLNEIVVNQNDYQTVLRQIRYLYIKAKLVHADLSEYNIFKYRKRITLFDFGSAVSVLHPMSEDFLKRDINNINNFFSKRGIEILRPSDILKRVTKY